MKKQVILAICLVLLIGSVLAVDVAKVGDWWGTAMINEEYANGAKVEAYIDNSMVASAIVGAIEPNYYLIHVEGTEVDNIVFKVNGKEATTQDWSNGDHKLDLEVSIDTSEENNDDNDDSPGGGSPSGDNPIIITAGTTDNQTSSTNDKEAEDIVKLNSENQEPTGPGIIGGVIGFAKSGVGIGLGIGIVIILIGICVVTFRKRSSKNEQ